MLSEPTKAWWDESRDVDMAMATMPEGFWLRALAAAAGSRAELVEAENANVMSGTISGTFNKATGKMTLDGQDSSQRPVYVGDAFLKINIAKALAELYPSDPEIVPADEWKGFVPLVELVMDAMKDDGYGR